jgi:hypothetical protein
VGIIFFPEPLDKHKTEGLERGAEQTEEMFLTVLEWILVKLVLTFRGTGKLSCILLLFRYSFVPFPILKH